MANDKGLALLVALMAMLLFSALGLALVLNTATEGLIAGNFRAAQEALYAADAGLELAVDELQTVPDWNVILRGERQSTFADGSPGGSRMLSDGTTIDLTQATNMLNCGHAAACSVAEMNSSTAERPWGANNPQWSLYAYAPLSTIVPGTINSSMYVAVWVADDQSENDDDPTTDGASQANPGSGVLVVRAEAFGPRATHKMVEATVARAQTPQGDNGVRILSWRELR
jgi:type IV pilus assembly PilX-like protein